MTIRHVQHFIRADVPGPADIVIDSSFRYIRSARCLVVASLAERVAQPLETLVQTVTGCGAS